MSDSIKDRLADDFEKVKTAGGTRLTRISEVFKNAASQAINEFKEGSGEIGLIAKDTVSTISGNLNQSTEEATVENSSSTDFKTLAIRIFNALSAEFRNQLSKWDVKLTERYSDRYLTAKQSLQQRLENFSIWYEKAKVNAEATGSDPLQTKQLELETRIGEAGTSVAQKEQQIRQHLKGLLQTAMTK
ncbi:hypothetical protein ACKFKF_25385 [Phormidesmis sp. 146-12]